MELDTIFGTVDSHCIYLKDIFHIRSTMLHPAEFELQHALRHSLYLPWTWVRQFVIVYANQILHTVTNAYMFSFRMNTQCCMIYQILYPFNADGFD